MSSEIHIEVKPGFEFATKFHAGFYKTCVDWTKRLNMVSSGGVSIWFYLQSQPAPAASRPSATICWNGKEMIRFFFAYAEGLQIYRTTYATDPGEFVDERNAWEEFLQPSLKALLLTEREEINKKLRKIEPSEKANAA